MAVPFILDENAIRSSPVLQLIQFERLLKEMLCLLNWSGWTTLPASSILHAPAVVQLNNRLNNGPRVRRYGEISRNHGIPDLVMSCPMVPAGEDNAEAEAAAAVPADISILHTFPAIPYGCLIPRTRAPPDVRDAAMLRAYNSASPGMRIREAQIAGLAADQEYDATLARAANAAAEARAAIDAAANAANAAVEDAANAAVEGAANAAVEGAANAAVEGEGNANAAVDGTANAVTARVPGAGVITVQVELCADCYHHGNGNKLKVIGVTRVEKTITADAAAVHQHHNHAVHVLEDDDDLIQHLRVACRNLAQLGSSSENRQIEEQHADLSQSRETAGYGSKVAKHLSQTLLNRSMIKSSILTAVFVVVGMKMFARQ